MKQICRNCHFLCKENIDDAGKVYKNLITEREREKVKKGEINFISDHYSLNCYLGVWDEGVIPGKQNRLNIVNGIKRNGECFFFPYNQKMLFKAAEELQKRKQENEQLKRSNLYTRIGLWIAAIGLLLTAIVFYYK